MENEEDLKLDYESEELSELVSNFDHHKYRKILLHS